MIKFNRYQEQVLKFSQNIRLEFCMFTVFIFQFIISARLVHVWFLRSWLYDYVEEQTRQTTNLAHVVYKPSIYNPR